MAKKKIEIEVRFPQFKRSSREPGPASPPADAAAWEALGTLDGGALLELGLRRWGEYEEPGCAGLREHSRRHVPPPSPDRSMLWVLPGEWYQAIPNGTQLVDIFFNEEIFELGVSDDDIRCGCLSYGIYGPR